MKHIIIFITSLIMSISVVLTDHQEVGLQEGLVLTLLTAAFGHLFLWGFVEWLQDQNEAHQDRPYQPCAEYKEHTCNCSPRARQLCIENSKKIFKLIL